MNTKTVGLIISDGVVQNGLLVTEIDPCIVQRKPRVIQPKENGNYDSLQWSVDTGKLLIEINASIIARD